MSEPPLSRKAQPYTAETTPRRPGLLLAVAAGLCWACALAALLTGQLGPSLPLTAPLRLIFCVLVLAAGLLTFVPFQQRLQLPGLALEGVTGTFLFLYTIAFVPPPNAWLLSLPELPVYVIMALALWWSISAAVLPVVYWLGGRLFRQRARQYDLRRARRQAHEIGALVALAVLLAGLRALRPIPLVLLALLLIAAELLFLSFIDAEPG